MLPRGSDARLAALLGDMRVTKTRLSSSLLATFKFKPNCSPCKYLKIYEIKKVLIKFSKESYYQVIYEQLNLTI